MSGSDKKDYSRHAAPSAHFRCVTRRTIAERPSIRSLESHPIPVLLFLRFYSRRDWFTQAKSLGSIPNSQPARGVTPGHLVRETPSAFCVVGGQCVGCGVVNLPFLTPIATVALDRQAAMPARSMQYRLTVKILLPGSSSEIFLSGS